MMSNKKKQDIYNSVPPDSVHKMPLSLLYIVKTLPSSQDHHVFSILLCDPKFPVSTKNQTNNLYIPYASIY